MASARQEIPQWQVDAFSAIPFEGNPAAVCLLGPGYELSDKVLQQIAAENNLSETAYIYSGAGGGSGGAVDCAAFAEADTFRLRWFTPTAEAPLCGHATLAAAHVLFAELGNPASALHFETLSGRLTVRKAPGPGPGRSLLQLDLPAAPPSAPLPPSLRLPAGGGDGISGAAPGGAAVALPAGGSLAALVAAATGGLGASHIGFAAGVDYLIIALPKGSGRKELEAIKPDIPALLRAAPAEEVHGVIVTAAEAAGDGYDFCSRFFGPWLGIDEDPVTGSAYCVLAPLWGPALGKTEMAARQCSARGGDVYVGWDPRGPAAARVLVSGEGVTTIRGTLLLR